MVYERVSDSNERTQIKFGESESEEVLRNGKLWSVLTVPGWKEWMDED